MRASIQCPTNRNRVRAVLFCLALGAAGAETAEPLATLAKSEELVVIGAERDGYVNVQSGTAAGWVRKVLLSRR